MSVQNSLLTVHILIPGCTSLKEKRSHIKPIISRIHREFNVSIAEVDLHDQWTESVLACSLVSNDRRFNNSVLSNVLTFMEQTWPDIQIIDQHIEFF